MCRSVNITGIKEGLSRDSNKTSRYHPEDIKTPLVGVYLGTPDHSQGTDISATSHIYEPGCTLFSNLDVPAVICKTNRMAALGHSISHIILFGEACQYDVE